MSIKHRFLEQLEEKIFSVTEYLELVNEFLSPLKVFVEGEMSDLKILPQWVFFSLKDVETGGVLRCGLHTGVYRRLGVQIEEGMLVKISGYGKISSNTGNFGFWVSSIEPKGEGSLKRAYELLIQKLQKEGLFERKRPLPHFISHIGIISSRNGVVVQDLVKNLDLFGIRIDFVHSGVEGASSAEELEKAITYFNTKKSKPEVLVVIRGGGSLESLQGFNNESVVRALFASPVPVLVGIGHDVDIPIATLVADWSASTPTAVAHVINNSWEPLTKQLPFLTHRILKTYTAQLQNFKHLIEVKKHAIQLPLSRVMARFKVYEVAVENAHQHFRHTLVSLREKNNQYMKNMQRKFQENTQHVGRVVREHERLLNASDPNKLLERGYGLVYSSEGKLVRSVEQVFVGDILQIRLQKGGIKTEVIKKEY